jgi:hypothetical protein
MPHVERQVCRVRGFQIGHLPLIVADIEGMLQQSGSETTPLFDRIDDYEGQMPTRFCWMAVIHLFEDRNRVAQDGAAQAAFQKRDDSLLVGMDAWRKPEGATGETL